MRWTYELVDEPKQPNRVFLHKELADKIIMDFRTKAVHEFRTRLGFTQYDVALIIKQSVLRKIKN